MYSTHKLLEKTFKIGTHKEFYDVNLKFHDQLIELNMKNQTTMDFHYFVLQNMQKN